MCTVSSVCKGSYICLMFIDSAFFVVMSALVSMVRLPSNKEYTTVGHLNHGVRVLDVGGREVSLFFLYWRM